MRFNSPPNWPAPPRRWQPGPGWEPDPAWGPPPAGWPLWVPDTRRRNVVIAVCAAALVLSAGGVGIWLLVEKPWESKGEKYAAKIQCAVDDDEEQKVCDSLRARFTALVDHDKERMRELTCAGAAPDERFEAEIESFEALFQAGDIGLALSDVKISGTKAQLTIRVSAEGESKSIRAEWKNEDGTWKACSAATIA
ncbi:MAG: hypothetical protein QOH57_2088 [Mycobacterium sp.]|jgi:hypothetical protein|nr:hypothetical protein [Mycobacterium sp.]